MGSTEVADNASRRTVTVTGVKGDEQYFAADEFTHGPDGSLHVQAADGPVAVFASGHWIKARVDIPFPVEPAGTFERCPTCGGQLPGAGAS